MQPTYVTFAQEPAPTANAVLRIDRGHAAGGHLTLDADGSVEMTFDVPAADADGEATLQIVALVSKLGRASGFAPLDIMVNDRVLARGEVVVIDEEFGIRVTEIVTPEERAQGLG